MCEMPQGVGSEIQHADWLLTVAEKLIKFEVYNWLWTSLRNREMVVITHVIEMSVLEAGCE